MTETQNDAALRLASFLTNPSAASLILAGLSVTLEVESRRFFVGKPKSTSGHFVPNYETSIIGCDDHEKWGGICFDGPVLTVYDSNGRWIVEHIKAHVAGTTSTHGDPGSFQESFDTLEAMADFVMRFYFRDQAMFNRVTAEEPI